MPRHRLSDAEWTPIHMMLKSVPGIWKNDETALRRFVDAAVYMLRTGLPWPDLPNELGEPDTVRRRFARWARKGLWETVFQVTAASADATGTAMIDSTSCKAHRSARGARGGEPEAIGQSRGGPNTKIHAVVDGLGRLVRLKLTPGQAHDGRQAIGLLEGLPFRRLLAERGYDAGYIRDWLRERGAKAVIPSLKRRKVQIPHDAEAYKLRHVVENAFCRLKDFVRVAHRRDKTALVYGAFVSLAAALLNIKLCP